MTFSFQRESDSASAVEAAPTQPLRQPALRQALGLLIGIFTHPRRTLQQVAVGSRWLWAIPLALAVLLLVARLLVWAPLQAQAIMTEQQRLQEASSKDMPPEMFSGIAPEVVVAAPPTSALITLPLLSGMAGILIGWLLRAVILHLGSMVLGGRQSSFGVLYRVAAWAGMPLILRDGVQALFMALSGEVITGQGLSGLVMTTASAESAAALGNVAFNGGAISPSPTVASILLGRIDLFTLWFLALLVLGVVAAQTAPVGAGKLARSKALVVVGFYILLSALAALAPLLWAGFGG